MINALGLLEVRGLAAGIEAADAMLKTAQVRLLSQTITNPALVTLVIEGDLAACRVALDAGAMAASKLGEVLVKKDIGRPEKDTEWFVTSFNTILEPENKGAKPKKTIDKNISEPINEVLEETTTIITSLEDNSSSLSEDSLVAFIMHSVAKGCNITEIIDYFNSSRTEVKATLKDSISRGSILKRGNRYYPVETKK